MNKADPLRTPTAPLGYSFCLTNGFRMMPHSKRVKALDDQEPPVSVIVPAFQAADTLAAAVRSVLRQTYRTLEVIIVDDGSTDATAAIAADFARADQRVRVVRKANGGLATAWNCGLLEARGAWVAPLDADDLWHPTKLEKQLAAASAAIRPVGFVYCFSRRIDADDRVLADMAAFNCAGKVLNRHVWRNFVGNGSACLYRRQAVKGAGGYDESTRRAGGDGSEDLLMQLKVARDWEVACVPEYLVGYRIGGGVTGDPGRMARAWANILETLHRDGFPVAPEAIRWASAGRTLAHAEALAWRGDWMECARLLVKSARLDPAGTATMLRWRMARALQRRISRRHCGAPSQAFFDADPQVPTDREPPAENSSNRVARLQKARLRHLESVDAKFSERPNPERGHPNVA